MTELKEITANEYKQIIKENGLVFCRQEFLELNKNKVDNVHYLLYKDQKNRLAFAIGEKNNKWEAPFSAPFATTIELQKQISLEYYWDFVKLLNQYAIKKNAKNISIFLPPNIYNTQENLKLTNALLGNNYQIKYVDLNFSFNLINIDLNTYADYIFYAARKNLNIALKSQLTLIKCTDIKSIKEAYEVIQINRTSKGYPLRMSFRQILDTIKIVNYDCFLVKKENLSIASAIIFHINDKIVQVIYWGNIPGIEKYKPINFLAYELIKYYKANGFYRIDIGPSSENGNPNYGLCHFKESIGCEISGKYKFNLEVTMSKKNKK